MMIEPKQPSDNDKTTFATNFYDRADDILQLVISDYIWQTYGYKNNQVDIERIVQSDTHGILVDSEKENVIARFIYNPNEGTWTLYAKERYSGGSESIPDDTF